MADTNSTLSKELYRTTGEDEHNLQDPETAHLMVHHNEVISSRLLEGLSADVEQIPDGVHLRIRIAAGTVFKNPVHLCFGMMPETGVQRIEMDIEVEADADISLRAHCTFPFAVAVQHLMNARIHVGERASYSYFERHIHSAQGGVTVVPKTKVELEEGAKFFTEFELLKGRVGEIDIDYETFCKANSSMEMRARINGTGDDRIKISETGHLAGENAQGVLVSHIAVRDNARADIYNKLTATAPFARGHVDCKEIVQDNGIATAVPVVEVRNPQAHVTHEAAIGSVDSRQLETLMARGLNEDDAVELIIQGILSR